MSRPMRLSNLLARLALVALVLATMRSTGFA